MNGSDWQQYIQTECMNFKNHMYIYEYYHDFLYNFYMEWKMVSGRMLYTDYKNASSN